MTYFLSFFSFSCLTEYSELLFESSILWRTLSESSNDSCLRLSEFKLVSWSNFVKAVGKSSFGWLFIRTHFYESSRCPASEARASVSEANTNRERSEYPRERSEHLRDSDLSEEHPREWNEPYSLSSTNRQGTPAIIIATPPIISAKTEAYPKKLGNNYTTAVPN